MSDKMKTSRRMVGAVSKDRDPNDYYPTHPVAVEDLCKYEDFSGTILEPTCGGGHMVEALKKYVQGLKNIFSSDLIDRGYTPHCGPQWDATAPSFADKIWGYFGDVDHVITNPPFDKDLLLPIVLNCLQIARKKVAIFARLNFLETSGRKEFFEIYPPSRIYVFSYRVPFARGKLPVIKAGKDPRKCGSGTMAFAWFVWDRSYSGPTIVRWI